MNGEEMYQLAKLAIAGRQYDIQLFLRRLAKRLRSESPEDAERIEKLLDETDAAGKPERLHETTSIPRDPDSRLGLVRPEYPVALNTTPVWTAQVEASLRQIIAERTRKQELLAHGLSPSRSALFTGAPGVGKTLAARWLASELKLPLLVLDLSAVMSSLLGRTGANVRYVLDYAKSIPSILLLDELDALAKSRNDASDVGELKRLVTVLLQEIDGWPPSGLLIGATNHPDLLDRAVWRRFDLVVEFPLPPSGEVERLVTQILGHAGVNAGVLSAVASAMVGESFSEIERDLSRATREAILRGVPLEDRLLEVVRERSSEWHLVRRKELAVLLRDSAGLSLRRASEIANVHRNTLTGIIKREDEE